MSEAERIKQEIAYYTALIENHKRSTEGTRWQPPPHTAESSTIPVKSSTTVNRRLVVSTKNKFIRAPGPAVSTEGRRTVVRTQNNNNRTVVFAKKPNSELTPYAAVPSERESKNSTNRSVLVTRHQASYKEMPQSSASSSRFVWSKNHCNSSSTSTLPPRATTTRKIVHSDSSTTDQNNMSSKCSRIVLGTKRSLTQSSKPSSPSTRTQPKDTHSSVDGTAVVKSKYKLVKKFSITKAPSSAQANKPDRSVNVPSDPHVEQKTISKYKIVRNSSNGSKDSRYSNKRRQSTTRYDSPHLSKSGKRLVSKYKIRRRSKELKKPYTYDTYAASPCLRSPKGGRNIRLSWYKLDRRSKSTRYKIDKLAHTRRRPAKLSHNSTFPLKSRFKWKNANLNAVKTFISPYKLNRQRRILASEKFNWSRSHVVRQIAGRALQRSALLSLRAKYKKNNTNDKHCLFYMRFGKCSRGDNCLYIHDPERIAVCTRYLRGTCTIEDCPFSHEAKKEKVPVCQHFLRGCCLRDSCPYLHVNVGRDAPICKNFAQHRYCHLGEKCKKLHTDICPERDDSGKCPKGRRCRLRHPKKMNKSELRQLSKHKLVASKPAQTEKIFTSVDEGPVIPFGEKLTSALPAYISLPASQTPATSSADQPVTKLKSIKLKTKPSFLE